MTALRRGARPAGGPDASWRARAPSLLAAGALSVAFAMTFAPGAGASGGRGARVIDPPVATSVAAAGGTWASVPMGRLGKPLTTFWQLFFLPTNGSRWTDRVKRLGMATNGGLLLSAPGGPSLVVGIRPSNLLHYSAVVRSANGAAWTPDPALDGSATAIAAASDGEVFALLSDRSGGRVLSASVHTAGWRPTVDARTVASSGAGSTCGPSALDALAAGPSGAPVLGASCSRAGASGVFADDNGTWRSIGPTFGAHDRVEVLSLRTAAGQLSALFALETGSRSRLVEGWEQTGGHWRLSGTLALARHAKLVSVGASSGDGEFVLSQVGGRLKLVVASPSASGWTSLPEPPSGTQTVAFARPGRVDALSVSRSFMTDWVLGGRPSAWVRGATVRVGILYGSSGV